MSVDVEQGALRGQELKVLLLIAAVIATVVAVYSDTFSSMARLWGYATYSHGVIAFPVAAFILWTLRRALAEADLTPWPWGLPIVAALVFAWFVGAAVGVQVLEHVAAVLLIPAAVAVCLGAGVARRALFPLLFLLAAVPFGEGAVPFLMRFTAEVSTALLRFCGVPVFRDGQFLSLPGGEFEIAEVCSGFKYLTAGTLLALLFAYMTYRSNTKRVVFLAVTAAALLLLNAIRAFLVMWVASASQMRWLAGKDHVYFGWVLFGCAVALLFWVGSRYADPARTVAAGGAGGAAEGRVKPDFVVLGVAMLAISVETFTENPASRLLLAAVAVALLVWRIAKVSRGTATQAIGRERVELRGWVATGGVVLVAAALIASGPMLIWRGTAAAVGSVPTTVALPAITGCAGPGDWHGDWTPELAGAATLASGSYSCHGTQVNAAVAEYANDSQGHELVGGNSRVVADRLGRGTLVSRSAFTVRDGGLVEVNRVVVEERGAPSVIWYWYTVGEHSAVAPTMVKARQVLQLLTRGRLDGTVYVLQAPGSSGDADNRLSMVAEALHGAFADRASAPSPRALSRPATAESPPGDPPLVVGDAK